MTIVHHSQQMYGCDILDFVDSATKSITFRAGGYALVVAGLLSDAQEQIEFDPNGARQTLNRAKYFLLTRPAMLTEQKS